MKKPLNITKGKAEVHQDFDSPIWCEENKSSQLGFSIRINDKMIWAGSFQSNKELSIGVNDLDEAKANANLIAEAFNVANETGLSPKDMKEQAVSLITALINNEWADSPESHKELFRKQYHESIIVKAEQFLQSIQKG